MRKRLDSGSSKVGRLEGLKVLVLVVALLLAVGVTAQGGPRTSERSKASQSQHSNIQTFQPSNVHSDLQTQTKWDVGQKDLLASMEAEKKTASAKEEPMYVTLLSFIFKLAVVAALAYGTIFALKRFSGLRNAIGANKHSIRVVENTALAANRSLHLVEIGPKRLLVASTPGQISLLTELEDSKVETVEPSDVVAPPSRNLPASVPQNPPTFGTQLAAFLGAKPDTGDAARNVAQVIRGSSAFLQDKIIAVGRLRKELRGL